MKMLSILAASGLALAATPALADHHGSGHSQDDTRAQNERAEVIQRDDRGRAMRVRMGGQEYDVCTRREQDGCINPREAGLNFGNRALNYWPGRPASEIDGPMPANRSQNGK